MRPFRSEAIGRFLRHLRNRAVALAKADNKGFTLIEVLLALAIFMMVMMPILDITGFLATSVSARAHAVQRIMAAESFMFEHHILTRFGKKPADTKKITDPATSLTFQSKETELKPYKGAVWAQVLSEWKEKGKKRIDKLISFMIKQKEA